ncbi:MAG TPA: MBL fold metallo-hydrolase [Methylomirabilota bacterium]|nr:MBL fold metallo-hydrolase [Methylomirabilota bacterium]
MKRAATILGVWLAVSITVGACASMQPGGRDLVARAVQTQGGADTLAGVKSVSYKATVRQWEPEQSAVAGGEMRLAGDATAVTTMDVAGGATRIDWVRSFQYPAPRTFTFSEIVTPQAGYVAGIDSNARNKQSQEANPPAHSMSGLRLAATQRELLRASPLLALEMSRNPDRVTAAPSVTIGGVRHPAVDYRVANHTLTVLFDPATGLPARVRSLDYDNMWGDVTYDLVLADWQTVGGVRAAMSHRYELNGRTVMEARLGEVAVNTPVAADRFAIPAPFLATARRPATGTVPYQWIIRRQFIGLYLDSEHPSYDTQAAPGLRLQELGPGIQHVVGGSHNSLIVEMKDHVIVFDAPISDWQSNWTISAARGKYVRKPVKYLVLTHHHMDHAGGLRAYADAGATIVVGQGTAAHYRRVLAAPFTRNPDLSPSDLGRTPIVEVAGKHVLGDGQRQVELHVLTPNPHAEGLLIGYVPDAKLGFVTDIWSPGAAPLPDRLNPALASLVAGVKRAGLTPEKFAGGHGGVGDYAPLAALEGK